MVGCIAQVVEHLLSKCEALSSNPSTAKLINGPIWVGNFLENSFTTFFEKH
jgi:hypothetical protein